MGSSKSLFKKADVWSDRASQILTNNDTTKVEISLNIITYLNNFDIQLTVSDKSRDCTLC